MKRTRLRTKFLSLFITISLAPLVLIAPLIFIRFQNALQQDAIRLGNQLSTSAVLEIQSFVISQVRSLDSLALVYNPEFAVGRDKADKIVENVLYKSVDFNDIAVVNVRGEQVVRQNRIFIITPEDLVNILDTQAFKTVKEKGIYVGPMYIQAGKPSFDVGRWILDADGNFTGAIFAQVDAKVMQQVTTKISNIAGPEALVYLVDEKGVVIAHPDLSYILSEKNLSNLPPVKNIVEGRRDFDIPQTYDNELSVKVIGSAKRVEIELSDLGLSELFPLNWFVVTEQQRSIVFAEAYRVVVASVLISLFVVGLAVIAAVFISRRISNPMENLYLAALEFGRGNLKYRAKIKSNDEIGDLALSFDAMASKLESSIHRLTEQEKIITAEKDQLTLILSGVTNAIIAVDLQRKIILFNKAAESLTGLKAKKVIGLSIDRAIRIFDKQKELPAKEYCPIGTSDFPSPTFSRKNLTLKIGKSEDRYIDLVSGTIKQGLSIRLGCILTFQDITREFLLEKTKGEFVSVAAHQLRTPLTGIKWTLQYLSSGEIGKLNVQQSEIVNDAFTASNRMTELVNDLLDVNRIEEGRYGIQMQKQSIVPVFQHLYEEFHVAAEKKGIALKLDFPKKLPPFNIDLEKLAIAINNLCDNAIKYTFPGKTVEIKGTLSKHDFVISFKDQGIGIPKSEFNRIFVKFFRSSQALLHHTNGTGLGLYVTKNIIEQHGGKIWFESEENKGTTFYVSLPLA